MAGLLKQGSYTRLRLRAIYAPLVAAPPSGVDGGTTVAAPAATATTRTATGGTVDTTITLTTDSIYQDPFDDTW